MILNGSTLWITAALLRTLVSQFGFMSCVIFPWVSWFASFLPWNQLLFWAWLSWSSTSWVSEFSTDGGFLLHHHPPPLPDSSSVVSSVFVAGRTAPGHFFLYIKRSRVKKRLNPHPVLENCILHACKEWFIIFFKKRLCTVVLWAPQFGSYVVTYQRWCRERRL